MTTEDKILEAIMGMQKDLVSLKQGQKKIEDELSNMKTEIHELRQNQLSMNDDLTFLVRKTMENNNEIQRIKLVK